MEKLLEGLKLVGGVAPSSDVYNGNPATDIVNLGRYDRVVFVIYQKTAGSNTGKATVTLEECDDVSASNSTAIAFKYIKNEAAGTSDTMSAWQTATSAGFSTTANKTAIYAVEVSGADLTDGYPYARLQLTEATNDPVIGSVLIFAGNGPKNAPDKQLSAIV